MCLQSNMFTMQSEVFTILGYEIDEIMMGLFGTLTLYQVINFLFLLTLSQTTNFKLFQTERVCRRKFSFLSKWQKLLQMGRKPCGKRRNCLSQALSPFPSVFSKDLYCRQVKIRACLGKG